MATLKKGQPGDADRLMGDSSVGQNQNASGLGHVWRRLEKKVKGGEKDAKKEGKGEKGDGIIR